MCETEQVTQWARSALSRRSFGAIGLAGAAAACASSESSSPAASAAIGAAAGSRVAIRTAAGILDGEFFAASGGRGPGVILWPDIAGIRPSKRLFARRLAEAGYAVLLANPYYRDVAGQQFADFADFAGNGGWEKVTPWRGRFNAATIAMDQAAAAEWLRGQTGVDAARGIGTQGYCMTGSFALMGPAADSGIRAGASFHGGGLVREDVGSPHRNLRKDAHYLIAIGKDDDAKAPGDKTALRAAADAMGCKAEIEVYAADHGWCVPDAPSYNQAEAERAWSRLMALYKAAL